MLAPEINKTKMQANYLCLSDISQDDKSLSVHLEFRSKVQFSSLFSYSLGI